MFFGTAGDLSTRPLAALLERGVPVSAVVVPRRSGAAVVPVVRRLTPSAPLRVLPLAGDPVPASVVELAGNHGVPVLEVGSLRDAGCLPALEPYRPDLICVACFPRILPASILTWPRLGCINLHPSLLPVYRGPAPLFWQFYEGTERSGVTIHIMDEGIDTGEILLQESFPLAAGITGAALASECAHRGARMMVHAVCRLPTGTLSRRGQGSGGSCHPLPGSDDFRAPVTRSARWAFRFIRGVAGWGAVTIEAGGRILLTRRALRYTEGEALPHPVVRSGDQTRIQFTPGVLEVTVERERSKECDS